MHDSTLLEAYARYHPRWFESSYHYVPTGEHLAAYEAQALPGWTLERKGIWYVASPPGTALLPQGWKLHVSACASDSVDCLRRALPVIAAAGAWFKFIVDPTTLSAVNGKIWPRGSSGKFIAIYPSGEDQFVRLGHELAEELRDMVGPYILSDRRWPGSRCVFYRYGGFQANPRLRVDGTRMQTIHAPDGTLVPDHRRPYWSPPEWASDPVAQDGNHGEAQITLDHGNFTVLSALTFSSRGGVYKAVDNRSGREVVIKESRPQIEVGRFGVDAIDVLEREHRLLTKLSSSGWYAQPVGCFRGGEHVFLAEELIPGEQLGRFTIRHNPLYRAALAAAPLARYIEDVRGLWLQLARAIASAHAQGVVLGDLSFGNVMVTEDRRLRIIDLECAVEEGVDPPVGLHTPGFAAPHTVATGIPDRANDYFALGAIVFGSVMLANGITGLYPPARPRFLEELAADLMLPPSLIALIDGLMSVSPGDSPDPEAVQAAIDDLRPRTHWKARTPRLAQPAVSRLAGAGRATLVRRAVDARDSILDYLRGTATPERRDRLCPGDVSLFETNPMSVAYGAAGVIYALHRIAGEVPEPMLSWLADRPIRPEEIPPGLYVGQAGIAWVLGEVGYPERAAGIMREARNHELLLESSDVMQGAAGFGLACLKLWAAGLGSDFLDDAVGFGHHLAAAAIRDEYGARWADADGDVPIGYASGGSGVALFLLYLHLATGDAGPLDLGRAALDFDLRHGVWQGGRLIGFPSWADDDSATAEIIPRSYWDAGTAGVATTLCRYMAVAPDADLNEQLDHLAADLCHKYAVFPQLFHGLAGLGNALLDVWQATGDERHLSEAWQIAEGILLFGIDRPEGLGFPGEQARRESADLATGAAGVALFLDRAIAADAGLPNGNFNFVVDELLPSAVPPAHERRSSAFESVPAPRIPG